MDLTPQWLQKTWIPQGKGLVLSPQNKVRRAQLLGSLCSAAWIYVTGCLALATCAARGANGCGRDGMGPTRCPMVSGLPGRHRLGVVCGGAVMPFNREELRESLAAHNMLTG